jgi:hypothetical protein
MFLSSTDHSISLPASTRLRRRSNGKPCMVFKRGRAPTAIVAFASVFWPEEVKIASSLLFGSPHLEQKGMKRPCTMAWERRCGQRGLSFAADAELALTVGVASCWRLVVSWLVDVWAGGETAWSDTRAETLGSTLMMRRVVARHSIFGMRVREGVREGAARCSPPCVLQVRLRLVCS